MEFTTYEEYAEAVIALRKAAQKSCEYGDFSKTDRYKMQLIMMSNIAPEWWERVKKTF